MITARRFTAFHKPLVHRTHCWSFPRLQQQWQVFLLPLIHCKERQTIVLFFRRDDVYIILSDNIGFMSLDRTSFHWIIRHSIKIAGRYPR